MANSTETPSSARTSVWPFPYTLTASSVRAATVCSSRAVGAVTTSAMTASFGQASRMRAGAPSGIREIPDARTDSAASPG